MNNDDLVTFRIPSQDLKKLDALVPEKFRNRSVIMRTALQMFMAQNEMEANG